MSDEVRYRPVLEMESLLNLSGILDSEVLTGSGFEWLQEFIYHEINQNKIGRDEKYG